MHRRPGTAVASSAGSCSRTGAAARPAGDRRRVPGRRAASGPRGPAATACSPRPDRRPRSPRGRRRTETARPHIRVQHRRIAERSRFTGRRLQRQPQHHARTGSESERMVTGLPPRAATGLGHERGDHADQLSQAADAHYLTHRTASHSISQLPQGILRRNRRDDLNNPPLQPFKATPRNPASGSLRPQRSAERDTARRLSVRCRLTVFGRSKAVGFVAYRPLSDRPEMSTGPATRTWRTKTNPNASSPASRCSSR